MKNIHTRILLITMYIVISCGFVFGQFVWEKYWNNPLEIHGTPGSWNERAIVPYVIFNPDSNRFEMWYTAFSGYPNAGIGFKYSYDGIGWATNYPDPVMIPSATGWDSLFVGAPCIIKESNVYKMWYTGWKSNTGFPHSIGYAESTDGGITWDKHPTPVLSPDIGWESGAVGYPSVIKVANGYRMFYTGEVSLGIARTGRAYSNDGINWQRDTENNPVLPAGDVGEWDRNNYLARVMEMNDSLYLWYTAESNPGVSGTAIGFATSADTGKTWTKYSGNPVLTRGITGSWDAGWIETGSVLFYENDLLLYYDGGGPATGNMGRVGLATSIIVSVKVILRLNDINSSSVSNVIVIFTGSNSRFSLIVKSIYFIP